jgi:molecular chaperone Hsp33
MKDVLLRATSLNGEVRIFAVSSLEIATYEKEIHRLAPGASIALGRALSAVLMMGAMLKNESDTISLQFRGNGPLRTISGQGNAKGGCRGYVGDPNADFDEGHASIGSLLGQGELTLTRDMGLKEPYISTVKLHSGEIADDLTHYFYESEQTLSSVGLGVLLKEDGTILASGGLLVQLMPGHHKETIDILEKNLGEVRAVTDHLKDNDPEALLRLVLGELGVANLEKLPVKASCKCSRERSMALLRTMGKEELLKAAEKDEKLSIRCAFCASEYSFEKEEIASLAREMAK